MITVKLGDGRELALEPVAPHEAMGLAEGCRHLSGVHQWWRLATTVASVRSIDGIPMPFPTHEKHIEGMIARFSRPEVRLISETVEGHPREEEPPELELRELTPLETLRIWAVIGEFETVPGWAHPAFTAAAVRKIGDDNITLPASKGEMKTLVARLGIGGMLRASLFRVEQATAAEAAEVEKQAAAKN